MNYFYASAFAQQNCSFCEDLCINDFRVLKILNSYNLLHYKRNRYQCNLFYLHNYDIPKLVLVLWVQCDFVRVYVFWEFRKILKALLPANIIKGTCKISVFALLSVNDLFNESRFFFS